MLSVTKPPWQRYQIKIFMVRRNSFPYQVAVMWFSPFFNPVKEICINSIYEQGCILPANPADNTLYVKIQEVFFWSTSGAR